MAHTAANVADKLKTEFALSVSVINARFAKPLDNSLLMREIARHKIICTFEDGALMGGFSSAILEAINEEGIHLANPIRRFGMQDSFIPHASQAEQYALHSYDAQSLMNYILEHFTDKKKSVVGI